MSVSPSPAFFEDEVTFDITVSGAGPTPTGNVQLSDSLDLAHGGFDPFLLPLSAGAAQFITNTLNPGNHVATATYQGDGTYDAGSFHTLTEQVVDVSEPTTILFGFSLVADFSSTGDADLVPQAALNAIPASAPALTSITLLWTVLNVPKIQITAPGGFDTGVITTSGTGAYVLGNGVSITTVFTLHALDAGGAPLIVGGVPLVTTATATVV
jgi:uncharacterized repeat protein (TIGR01451 family)